LDEMMASRLSRFKTRGILHGGVMDLVILAITTLLNGFKKHTY